LSWTAPLAFGSFGTNHVGSSNNRATVGHRFLKRFIVATTMLLAMSKETLVADGPGLDPIELALVGTSIDWRSFDATTLGHDNKLAQRITKVQILAEKDYLITYFLDQVPNNINISTMPKTARDVVIARVSLARKPVYLVKREQSDESAPPKNLFRSQLKILQVIGGRATVGENLDVTFGVPDGSGKLSVRPLTPSQVNRDYFVVAYTDDDDQRRLAGFPIDEAQYLRWESEAREFTKLPWKPGTPK
jgi:hypothetical protein